MPFNWSMIDNDFPTFSGEERAKDQINRLTDYMFKLVEQIKYNMKNLDTTNWNSTALDKFRKDTTKDVEKGLKTVSDDLSVTAADLLVLAEEVADIGTRLLAMENTSRQMEEDIAYLQKEQDETGEWLDALEEAVENSQADINELEETVKNARTDIDELMTIFQRTENGAAIGEAGMDLHLLGNVYINGKLVE